MRKENSTIKTSFRSEAGSYLKNADYFAFVELEDCAMYCLADGIDTEKKKESARLAVTAAIETFQSEPKFSKGCLRRCIRAAHEELKRESKQLRLEASILLVLTNYQKLRYVQAGNVRLHLFRENRLKWQSKDHSLSQTLAEQGKLPVNQVEEHEERHNLYCYLGQPEKFKPEYSKKYKLKDGDILLLATRGIWEHIGTAEYLDAIEEAKEPEEVCGAVEEVLLSRQLPELENYTIACLFLDKLYQNSAKKKKLKKLALAIGIPVLVLCLIGGITQYLRNKSNQKQIEQMLERKESGIQFFEEESYTRASKEFTEALSLAQKIRYRKGSATAKEVEELEAYDRLVQLLVDAEQQMEKERYADAVRKYELAEKQAKEILSISEEEEAYLKKQKEEAKSYYDIQDLLTKGDNEYAIENYEEAIEAYTEAARKASALYAAEERKMAAEKLSAVKTDVRAKEQEELKKQAADWKEEAEQQKEKGNQEEAAKSYEKAKELYETAGDDETAKEMKEAVKAMQTEEEESQKEEKKQQGDRLVLSGDRSYEAGDYKAAATAYLEAIEAYAAAEEKEQRAAAEAKLLLAEDKNTALAKQKAQAELYILHAEKKSSLGDSKAAEVLYGLAEEIYLECGLTSEAGAMKQKRETLAEETEQKEEQARKEQEEETKQKSSAEPEEQSTAETPEEETNREKEPESLSEDF